MTDLDQKEIRRRQRSRSIVMGAALLQVLRNLVNLLDIPGSLDFAVMGAVILLGAFADQVVARRAQRRASA